MSKGVTIRQLYNKGVEELGQTFNLFSGLLPDDEKSTIKYIAEYEKKPKLYDMYFLDNYGEIAYSLIRPLSDISIEDFQWRVSAWQLMNKYKLNKLYESSLLTYNKSYASTCSNLSGTLSSSIPNFCANSFKLLFSTAMYLSFIISDCIP